MAMIIYWLYTSLTTLMIPIDLLGKISERWKGEEEHQLHLQSIDPWLKTSIQGEKRHNCNFSYFNLSIYSLFLNKVRERERERERKKERKKEEQVYMKDEKELSDHRGNYN